MQTLPSTLQFNIYHTFILFYSFFVVRLRHTKLVCLPFSKYSLLRNKKFEKKIYIMVAYLCNPPKVIIWYLDLILLTDAAINKTFGIDSSNQ